MHHAWIGGLLVVLMPAMAAAQGRPSEGFETVKVADGVYAFIAPEPKVGIVQGNSVAVIGDDGVLVVDTGQFPALARRMIKEIRELTGKPVRFVVNTHWHGDHLLGNGQYREAFPGVVLLGHAETRRMGDKFYGDFEAKNRKSLEDAKKEDQEALAKGHTSGGRPLSALDREYLEIELAEIDACVAGMPDTRYLPPELTLEHEVTVHLGQRAVKVMHLGRGNTSGDVVVYVPDASVLMAGDLVVNPTPYSFGSFLGEWRETLRKVVAVGATTIVPGHGPVMKNTEYVEALIELLGDTRRQVEAAAKEGLSLEDTRKKVDLRVHEKRLAGDDYWRKRAFAEFFVAPAVGRAYKEAKGEPLEQK